MGSRRQSAHGLCAVVEVCRGDLRDQSSVGDRGPNVRQDTDKLKRLTASSVPCSLSTMTDSHYVYIELRNPNATDARVELGVAQAPGQPRPNVLIAAYGTLPVDAAGRKACLTGAELGCSSNTAYAACLAGTKTPKIPAGGSAWIYVGNFQGTDAPLTFSFTVKVNAL